MNINWQKGKAKLVEFSELNNSLKRTVMLTMIIMSSRFGPVIIDAPENYLDNVDIAEILVPVIKRSKDFRQIIFFTSNPMLAVNSDPENYILLKSGLKKRSRISFGFSIDEADKKFQVIDLIEGGIKSFKKRSKRYSL